MLNKFRCHAHFLFSGNHVTNPGFGYKVIYLMTKSADPDQLVSKKPTDMDPHCLQRHCFSELSRTRVNSYNRYHQCKSIVATAIWVQLFIYFYLFMYSLLFYIFFFFFFFYQFIFFKKKWILLHKGTNEFYN